MNNSKLRATLFAILAAVFYALNMPLSKLLLKHVSTTMMAGYLYLGAGLGVGTMFFANRKSIDKKQLLSKADIPYTIGMVVLDIIAPICLMLGLSTTSSANASLLNNFEIVATSIIAMLFFKEKVSSKLWLSIILVTASSIVLSFEKDLLTFSWGSILVLLATVCWGLENNCTRSISSKNTYEIVTIKGLCSGLGAVIVALVIGEKNSELRYIIEALALGFVAYGLSIFFYIKAQEKLGAAKTSAYYAIAPFVGALLSFVLLKEPLTEQFMLGFVIMIIGSAMAVWDTL
ncbi:MAG: DMT family transporter [Sphaerochaetaceae bacterium]|nr:DMT family transporter [Sphaerochaetaceae bacterium]